MELLLLVFGSIIVLLLGIIFIEKFCKTKSSTEIILIGIEFTLVAIALWILRSNSYNNNDDFILMLLGTVFLILGLIVSIYGISKKI